MTHPVKEKRSEAESRYKAGLSKIEEIVKLSDGQVTLDDLEKLSNVVEETRLALKDVQLWDGVLKTQGEK